MVYFLIRILIDNMTSNQNPSHLLLKRLLNFYENDLFDDAEVLANLILEQYPDNQFALKVLSAILKKTQRFEDALLINKKSIGANPKDPEAYYNIANTFKSLNRYTEAINNYKKAIAINPRYADAYNNLSVTLKDSGNLKDAEVFSIKAISYNQENPLFYFNLGDIHKKNCKFEAAQVSFEKALEIDPNFIDARYMLAALIGENVVSAPRSYVENLFDTFAPNFDNSLVNNLEYKVPKLIAEIIRKNYNSNSLGSVLDLGCGTGLVGEEVRKYCKYLEGIDLSNSMLEIAKRKNIYDKLEHRDILEYLKNKSLNFNIFISADVFVYIGDLSNIFRLIKSRNQSGGKIIFSTEHNNENEFVLEGSGRFSHSKSYIERLCKEFNYTISYFEKINLRKEKELQIEGGFYILDF